VNDLIPSPETIDALRRGDAEALEALLRAWSPVVLRWCARLGGPGVNEEDAASDVFLQVLAKMETIRDLRAFPAWMFRTTRRVVAMHRRRAWLRRWIPGLVPDTEDPSDGPGVLVERSDTARRVQSALSAMPADLREVVVLCDMEERPDSQVAELLGLPVGTVKSRLRRARRAFGEEAFRLGLRQDDAARETG
jgi:RNA polymerase sigma-70 factor (ECF subfamily)